MNGALLLTRLNSCKKEEEEIKFKINLNLMHDSDSTSLFGYRDCPKSSNKTVIKPCVSVNGTHSWCAWAQYAAAMVVEIAGRNITNGDLRRNSELV